MHIALSASFAFDIVACVCEKADFECSLYYVILQQVEGKWFHEYKK